MKNAVKKKVLQFIRKFIPNSVFRYIFLCINIENLFPIAFLLYMEVQIAKT